MVLAPERRKQTVRRRSVGRGLDLVGWGAGGGVGGSTDSGSTLVVLVVVSLVGVVVLSSDLVLERVQGDSGEDGVLVNNRSIVNLLVDGDGGVDVSGLDGLLLDDWLDGLVDVVVDVLVGNRRSLNVRPLRLPNGSRIPVQVPLLVQLLLVLWEHVVLGLPGYFRDDIVLVLGREGLVGLDGLDTVLVVVDVTFTVDGLGGFDFLLGLDVLLGNWGSGFSADLGGVGLVRTGEERLDVVDGAGHFV